MNLNPTFADCRGLAGIDETNEVGGAVRGRVQAVHGLFIVVDDVGFDHCHGAALRPDTARQEIEGLERRLLDGSGVRMVDVRVADGAFVGGLALLEHRVISVVGANVETM